MSNELDNAIQALPSKEFFIDMLTKDISLQECILDLLDNSVHSLIRQNDLDVMQSLFEGKLPRKSVDASVKIEFSPTLFRIKDTCGGISIKEAKEQIFLFGKPQPDPKHTGLGVYGIGMKRAMFKIGEDIKVQSHTTTEKFLVELNVPTWKKSPNWTLNFTHAEKAKSVEGGTTIEVRTLLDTPEKYFGLTSFKQSLIQRISVSYALFIKAGLEITVNGTKVEGDIPSFAEGKELKPVRQAFKKDGVDVLVLAGLSPRDDRRAHGWYIFCNGRLVLEADKTEKTGWGLNHVPNFHPKYNHFLGFVYFRSKDVRKLPWTTTKEGVERESKIYQYALQEMRSVSRAVLDFLNDMYGDIELKGLDERHLLDNAKEVKIEKVAGRKNTGFVAEVAKRSENDLVVIQYKKSRKDVEKVKKAIGGAM